MILGIEIKVWRDRRPDPIIKGLEQLESYLARLGQDFGWLVIFDRRTPVADTEIADIADRLMTTFVTTEQGRTITVIRA
jgi:hypothetical protein